MQAVTRPPIHPQSIQIRLRIPRAYLLFLHDNVNSNGQLVLKAILEGGPRYSEVLGLTCSSATGKQQMSLDSGILTRKR